MSEKKYRNYFQINESYFPAVNEDVIKSQPDVWKSYYPHESFIKLLNQTKSVLTNSQRMSIWVEGAYGTGKSHAVLTLKRLLDCSNEELKEYFDKYQSVLSKDLYNEFYNIKNQEKKILTVHRYGSSDVDNDKKLMQCVQNSIINALKEKGYDYEGQVGLKQAMINWLSDNANRAYFNTIIQSPEFKYKFDGANADTILENLKTYTADKAIQELVEKVASVGEERGINTFVLTKEDLRTWILDVISKNNLKSIFFIWDEFSDYFNLNKGNLSGFQFLAELSETFPFYFVIVTHKSDIFFENSRDDTKTKINGRFIAPHCSIELPDNMAFILTGHAMQKVADPTLAAEWDQTVEDLYNLTYDSREQVIKTAKIGEKELKGVLPIHPYAALILKHIASAYDSNQRSMFDFIKNDRGDEIKGFQWYIDNYGPEDEDNLLTVDMLWDFFYEKGKDQLSAQIRAILDVYGRTESHNLNKNQKKVLKTILLLQAINEKVGDSVTLFIPNDKNLALAFEGTEVSPSNARSIAAYLVKEQIIFERPMGGGQTKYSALVSNGNLEEIEKEKERLRREVHTDKLIEEGEFLIEFKLPKYLEMRYPAVKHLTAENIKMEVSRLKGDLENHPTRLYAVFTFGKNEEESNKIREEIQKTFDSGFEKIVFIDYSGSYLSSDLYNQYIDNMANCNYQKGKDSQQSRTYDKNAKEALRRWRIQIKNSCPKVFTSQNPTGNLCNNDNEIYSILKEMDRYYFEFAVETYVNVIDNMYASNNLGLGAECGITGDIKGTFKSNNENTKLDKQFSDVWNLERYWEIKPGALMSKFKIAVENLIKKKLDESTRVSIREIYDVLAYEPFGFMPSNLSAFILGYVLREYSNDTYNWTDDLTTVPMTVDKMKEMISGIIKQQQNPSPKYKDNYIVAMSPEQRQFNKSTSYVFSIDESSCSSVENTRSRVRSQMTAYKFPIWVLKYHDFNTSNSKEVVSHLIDLYVDLANNSETGRTETDIALEIGSLFLENKGLDKDLKNVLTNDNCRSGMQKYLEHYNGGKLIELANKLNDSGSYITEISGKFSEASNWVWNKKTVDEKIDETITEYEIVVESNKYLPKTSSYSDCLKEWNKKTQSFKVSFNSIKGEVGSLSNMLSTIYQIKKNGYIYDSEKSNFLNDLKEREEEFKNFCDTQLEKLKEIGKYYFTDLDDKDIQDIANKSIYDVYTLEHSEFIRKVEESVNSYKANMAKYKLLSLWKENTASENPYDWSEKNSMPILCMVPAQDQEKARRVFAILSSSSPDSSSIDEAMNYLDASSLFNDLKDSLKRENNFKKCLLKNHSSLIDNIDEIKQKLRKEYPHISPYNWLGSTVIDDYIENFAYQKYIHGGSEIVDNIIDSMSPEDLKVYLKKLVQNNMNVGIEIINSKK